MKTWIINYRTWDKNKNRFVFSSIEVQGSYADALLEYSRLDYLLCFEFGSVDKPIEKVDNGEVADDGGLIDGEF